MRRFLFPVIILAVLSLSGCGWVLSLFASGEAAIVEFSYEGIDGTATVDPEARTVEITIPPINLASVTPVVEVTEGADLGPLPAFADGVPATVSITAENGDVVEWTVTVNLELGVSFLLNGERVIVQGGFTSTDPGTAEDYGNGVPPASVYSFGTGMDDIIVPGSIISPPNAWNPDINERIELYVEIEVTGSNEYSTGDFYLYYEVDGDDDGIPEIYFVQESGTATVNEIAAEVGDIVSGVFAAAGVNEMASGDLVITDGFFKVQRIVDDAFGE
jgi:hypothetical protein